MNNPFKYPAYQDAGGIWRWVSNGHVPPPDAEGWDKVPDPLRLHCFAARDKNFAEFLAEYRRNYTGPTDEERAEARAAHGPGVTLVNVFTGAKWTT